MVLLAAALAVLAVAAGGLILAYRNGVVPNGGSGALPPGGTANSPVGPGQPAAPGASASPPASAGVVVYEAESGANSFRGSAVVAKFAGSSGGRVVEDIGNWHAAGGPGALRFDAVKVTRAGRYTLTFFAVNPSSGARLAIISVPGNRPIHVTVPAGAVCCAQRTFIVYLYAGWNPVTISNPHGRAPAIDRIALAPRS
ncbi:MAG: hypothetical protein J2P15_09500 [Micromonosporaceae bacterium]|nr:hypothetical protein [Micromonosporaceae bacterium]